MPKKAISKKETPAKPTQVKAVKSVEKKVVKSVAKAVVSVTPFKGKTIKASVLDTRGKAAGEMQLPEEMFAAEINANLMTQAIRVYLANQRAGTSSTKTRGEVRGSTRKIYRQKGTGRARHGGIRAPIFVGGGIAFGPKPRDYSLSFPKKMRRKALFSALSSKMKSDGIKIVKGMAGMTSKTKDAAHLLDALSISREKGTILVVTSTQPGNVVRAAQNLAHVSLLPCTQVHTYAVYQARTVVFMQEAIDQMVTHYMKEGK